MHWPELGMLLESIDYHEAARKASFLGSMCEDSLMAAIHFERRFDALMKYVCDKLDRICQVGFAGAWHWLASGHSDAYYDVFDVCACVCAVWMVVRTLYVWWKLA